MFICPYSLRLFASLFTFVCEFVHILKYHFDNPHLCTVKSVMGMGDGDGDGDG